MKKRNVQKLVIVLSATVVIAICISRLLYYSRLERNEEIYAQLSTVMIEMNDGLSLTTPGAEEKSSAPDAPVQSGSEPLADAVEKKIDFGVLRETNQDIYAWITIDGTKVNYPILQNKEDNYYLRRCIDGKNGMPGCIYTNACTSKDFSSWNSIVYGHNMSNGTMFGSLQLSTDWEDTAEYVNVITENEKLRYRVYAVVQFSNVYLPELYDETTNEGRTQFLEDVKAAVQQNGYLREGMEISEGEKLLTLSTCIKRQDDKRMLVVAVLEE